MGEKTGEEYHRYAPFVNDLIHRQQQHVQVLNQRALVELRALDRVRVEERLQRLLEAREHGRQDELVLLGRADDVQKNVARVLVDGHYLVKQHHLDCATVHVGMYIENKQSKCQVMRYGA